MRWLLIDVSSICYQLFYAMNQDAHSVPQVFLNRVEQFKERFDTTRAAFFFDKGKSKRVEICKEYKANRKDSLSDEQVESLRLMKQYIKQLALEILPNNGHDRIFYQSGYEADDLIASACDSLSSSAAIVTTDKDLYQCISTKVSWCNGKEYLTKNKFTKQYGIEPSQWADAKAIAGCPTDNIKGVPQVGEKSAIMFLRGNLFGWRFQRIVTSNDIWERNLELVRLPFKGTMEIVL